MFSLIKKYGAAAVEDACATALDIGVAEHRFVRRYLERRPHPQMFLRQIDPLIRELTEVSRFPKTIYGPHCKEAVTTLCWRLCSTRVDDVQEIADLRACDLQLTKPFQARLFGKGKRSDTARCGPRPLRY